MIRPPVKHVYEFGAFSLDPAERLLRRHGEQVPLTPKVFDILLVLVRHPGQVLEKEELLKQVWPDTFVEEANLSVHISALRKALGEGPGEHQYIETLPRRGYRFVAPVTQCIDEGSETLIQEHTRTSLTIEEESGEGSAELPDEHRLEVTGRGGERARDADSPPRLSAAFQQTGGRERFRWLMVAAGTALLGLGVVAVWFWRARQETSSRPVRAVAVLPFTLWDAASEDQFLGLGLADTLITKLSNLPQIVVRPTSAVQKYTSQGQDPVAAGRELRVDAVLEGSIHRAGDRVRVTVRFLNVGNGAPLWAGKFDEKFTDLFAVEDAISERVAEALTRNLTPEQRRQLTKRYTENPEAYQLYLKGRHFWNKFTEEGFHKAGEYLRQAIEKDPGYALAHAGLASAYAVRGATGILPPAEAMPQAEAAAERALGIDDTLAEAHAARGSVKLFYEWDWPAAESELKRAVELNPSSADAYQLLAYALAARGRLEEARAEAQRALEVDPLRLLANTDAGWIETFARQYSRAAEQYRQTLEFDPNFAPAHSGLGRVYQEQGRFEDALAELNQAITLSGRSPRVLSTLGNLYAASGKPKEAEQVLQELAALSERRYISAFYPAVVYIGLGQKDQAFAWLERALEERTGLLIFLSVDPWFDPLRPDPRFAALVRRIGLAA